MNTFLSDQVKMKITANTRITLLIIFITISMKNNGGCNNHLKTGVSGAYGVCGQLVQTRAAVESGNASDGLSRHHQDLAARASRHRAKAATQDSAQV